MYLLYRSRFRHHFGKNPARRRLTTHDRYFLTKADFTMHMELLRHVQRNTLRADIVRI